MNHMLLLALKERGYIYTPPPKKKVANPTELRKRSCGHVLKRYKQFAGVDRNMRLHTLIWLACEPCKKKQCINVVIS